MNKEKKRDILCIVLFMVCAVISFAVAAKVSKAEGEWEAKTVAYNVDKTNLKSNNVSDALDELNAMIDGNNYNPNNSVECTSYTDGCKKTEKVDNPKTVDNIGVVILLMGVSTAFFVTAIKYLLKVRKK